MRSGRSRGWRIRRSVGLPAGAGTALSPAEVGREPRAQPGTVDDDGPQRRGGGAPCAEVQTATRDARYSAISSKRVPWEVSPLRSLTPPECPTGLRSGTPPLSPAEQMAAACRSGKEVAL